MKKILSLPKLSISTKEQWTQIETCLNQFMSKVVSNSGITKGDVHFYLNQLREQNGALSMPVLTLQTRSTLPCLISEGAPLIKTLEETPVVMRFSVMEHLFKGLPDFESAKGYLKPTIIDLEPVPGDDLDKPDLFQHVSLEFHDISARAFVSFVKSGIESQHAQFLFAALAQLQMHVGVPQFSQLRFDFSLDSRGVCPSVLPVSITGLAHVSNQNLDSLKDGKLWILASGKQPVLGAADSNRMALPVLPLISFESQRSEAFPVIDFELRKSMIARKMAPDLESPSSRTDALVWNELSLAHPFSPPLERNPNPQFCVIARTPLYTKKSLVKPVFSPITSSRGVSTPTFSEKTPD